MFCWDGQVHQQLTQWMSVDSRGNFCPAVQSQRLILVKISCNGFLNQVYNLILSSVKNRFEGRSVKFSVSVMKMINFNKPFFYNCSHFDYWSNAITSVILLLHFSQIIVSNAILISNTFAPHRSLTSFFRSHFNHILISVIVLFHNTFPSRCYLQN